MREPLEKTPPAPFDDAFSFWTYKDLQARHIVASRTDLHRKQHFYGFPSPIVLTGGGRFGALQDR